MTLMLRTLGISETVWQHTPAAVQTKLRSQYTGTVHQSAEINRLNSEIAALKEKLGQNSCNSSLPPTTIINAQIDPLRSEGELLAQKMRAAGVRVEQKTYNNVVHEFFGTAAVVDQAKAAQAQAFKALRTAFRD